MRTPYTTKSGVRIGSAYTPNAPVYHDRDALRLQDALLKNKPAIDKDGIFIAAVVAVVIAIPVVHHFIR